MNREGFWYSESEKDLPHPVMVAGDWESKAAFLTVLTAIEKH